VTVNNTDPVFFYCAQVGHCQAGMVFALNPSVCSLLTRIVLTFFRLVRHLMHSNLLRLIRRRLFRVRIRKGEFCLVHPRRVQVEVVPRVLRHSHWGQGIL
jgi:hypothetical protein